MYGTPSPSNQTFKEGDRVQIVKKASTFNGLKGKFLKYEGAHLCRIRLDDQGSSNALYDCGLIFFVREIEPLV